MGWAHLDFRYEVCVANHSSIILHMTRTVLMQHQVHLQTMINDFKFSSVYTSAFYKELSLLVLQTFVFHNSTKRYDEWHCQINMDILM